MGGLVRITEVVKDLLRIAGRASLPKTGRRVVALCYHSVHPSIPFRSAEPGLFSDHLEWLAEHCDCVPFNELLTAWDRQSGSRPVVSITFDDGYADNHEYALPLLVKNHIPATFFLTTGLLNRDASTIERFQRLWGTNRDLIQPLAWDQVTEFLETGMEVGAHTDSHPNLARLDERGLERELGQSKHMLEDRLGRAVTMMAYPFGRPRVHFTADVERAVQRAGYGLAGAIGTRGIRETDDPLSVPRIFVTNDSVEELSEKVLGVWDLIGIVREKMPLALSRVVSPADFRV
jgi:peptidoglycan/xylan/chitin deacetylase (PgdA/CDA1 family)